MRQTVVPFRTSGEAVMERFVPIALSIAEHLLRGDISAFEFGVYVIVQLQADYSTGIWRGCAPRILNSAPRGAKLREIQRALEHLTELGLLRPFHKHGQRGNFPFLINKFTVRSGALTGMRLNADRSESWQSPAYEFCVEADTDSSADVRAQDAPIQEARGNKEKGRKKRSIAPAAPSLFFSCEYFSVTEKQDAVLGEAFPWVDRQAEYRRAHSWLEANPERRPKKANRFLHNWFSRIRQPEGKGNGKDLNEAVAATMYGFAVNAGINH
jgi:hypothetical protein